MQGIKNKIEAKIAYFFLAIINSKESKIDSDSCDEEYINKYREVWESLSFEPKSTIKIKVENLDNFEFEQNEPFYDKENKKIYYKNNNPELDEFSDILIEILEAPKSLNDNFKYILTKDIGKIKIEDNELFNSINSKWIRIDDNTKNIILEELKKIGFKDDIVFKLSYTKEDYDCNKFQKTVGEIQIEINELIEDKEFKIVFDCILENKLLIEKIKNRYIKLEYPIEDESDLHNSICLSENDIYKAMKKNKDDLDKELEGIKKENITTANKKEISLFKGKNIPSKAIQHSVNEVTDEELKKSLKAISEAKNQRGSEAEYIFAKSIYEDSFNKTIKDNLDNFIPKNWTKTREKLLNGSDFEKLIISITNVKAGYDVVGVEDDKIILYEVKAVNFDNSYLYLSNNEIRKLRNNKRLKDYDENISINNIEWRLIGVDKYKKEWINLTENMYKLLFEDNGDEKEYLKKLMETGIYYDSLLFKFSIKI